MTAYAYIAVLFFAIGATIGFARGIKRGRRLTDAEIEAKCEAECRRAIAEHDRKMLAMLCDSVGAVPPPPTFGKPW